MLSHYIVIKGLLRRIGITPKMTDPKSTSKEEQERLLAEVEVCQRNSTKKSQHNAGTVILSYYIPRFRIF